ncbi:MAG: hypothetical protein MUC87_04050 [Bacteroidia bacterium]|jgi:hypothetical protein|nr:hypothetical protein [Bacteroidia bacterium]
MKQKTIFASLAVVMLLVLGACNKTKQASERISGATWKVTTLTVNGVAEEHMPNLTFEDCDIYGGASCKGDWKYESYHAHFIWQFREKADKFELSNQSDLEDAHGGGHEAEENIIQCQNFSGVYEVKERKKDVMEFTTTNAVGFPGQTVVMKLEKM